ncbi:MAG: nitronate monooxygenase [bacterium]
MSLRTPICDLFEIEVPIFLAGMSMVASADVCAAVSQAGGYGVLGMAQADAEGIRQEMRKVREQTDKPFGVDLLAALPEAIMASIDVIIEGGASCFAAGLGVPGPVIERCHDAGVKVMVVCGKVDHAKRSEDAGCDAVVAQGTEAGGHTGKVAGMALIPQMVDAVEIPVLGAGSIVDGRGIAAAMALGAQGAWMGTRFIATKEATASQLFKEEIVARGSADTQITRCYSGKPMRVITNPYVEEWEQKPEKIQRFPDQMMVSLQANVWGYSSDLDSDRTRTAFPSGQGIGGIGDIPSVAELMPRLVAETEATLGRLAGLA